MPATETRDGAPERRYWRRLTSTTRTTPHRPPPWDRRQRRRRVDGRDLRPTSTAPLSSSHCPAGDGRRPRCRPRSTSSRSSASRRQSERHPLGVRRKRSGCARSDVWNGVCRVFDGFTAIAVHAGGDNGRCRCADVTESASLPRKQVAAALAGRHYKRPPLCGRGSGDGLIRCDRRHIEQDVVEPAGYLFDSLSSACALSADFARARRSNGAWAGRARPARRRRYPTRTCLTTTRRRRLPRSRRHRAARRRTSPAPVCRRLRRRQRRTAHPGPVSPLSRQSASLFQPHQTPGDASVETPMRCCWRIFR